MNPQNLSPEELELLSQLRDIRPIVEVPDISLYLLIGIVLLGVLLLSFLGWYAFRRFRKDKRASRRATYLQKLKEVDLSDSKKAAYTITRYGRLVADDEQSRNLLAELVSLLEPYKYKKNVDDLSDEAIRSYHLFLGVVDA